MYVGGRKILVIRLGHCDKEWRCSQSMRSEGLGFSRNFHVYEPSFVSWYKILYQVT
jgi:hypothetical protein